MSMRYALPAALAAEVTAAIEEWRARDGVRRLWTADASLWTGADEARWLGWLGVVDEQRRNATRLGRMAEEVAADGFGHALLLGMGGSSLGPEVLAQTFGPVAGRPALLVLDSTDPAQVKAFEERIDLARTLFIISSKSGSTLEPNILMAYFQARVREAVGGEEVGRRFVAITDPGSTLERAARQDGFRAIFPGVPTIGGRYSVLSNFGLVPAAVMGLDVAALLERAGHMARACAPSVPAAENPGLVLGVIMGILARRGVDKLTVIASPTIHDLGAWLEQLLAESTGKAGRGIIPVDGEQPGEPAVYGDDRLFAYLRLDSAPDAEQDAAVAALEAAGKPVVRLGLRDPRDLAAEFFRWEFATAVAGAVLGINPFDQPDVEASKVATRTLTARYEQAGALPPETPIIDERGIRLFADPGNAKALAEAAGGDRSLAGYLGAHLARLGAGDYLALLAYVHMNAGNVSRLQGLRHRVRDRRRVATCVGFGPRFLHSTGQAYKGGPNRGVFLQITCDDARDLPVPGRGYTFGVVKAAQARGDFQVLAERGRRALRVHLAADVEAGLLALDAAVDRALADAR
jgi:transaldolase/glucose-6-phosphate isomerase